MVPGAPGTPPTTLTGTASLRLRPTLAGALSFTAGGQSTVERIVGNSIYIDLSRIAAHDGGRPWVVVDLADVSTTAGINYSELLQQAERVNPTSTLRLLAAARIFHQTAATTIDGQRVIGLHGAFTPAVLRSPQLTAGFSRALVAQLEAKLVQAGATSEDVTTYLSSAGLPVRIVTTLHTKAHGTLTTTVDIRAINGKVDASPPPASQTITLAAANKLGG